MRKSSAIDLTGHVYSRLTVICRVENCGKIPRWLCKCECGNERIVKTPNLRNGDTKSCGCIRGEKRVTHGETRNGKLSKTYATWAAIIRRCIKPQCKDYPDYGGRGIGICEAWMKFENFMADMGEKPEGKSIDRIDNSKGYSPSNCRWATVKEQANNKRSNRLFTHNGVTRTLAQWLEISKVNKHTAIWRVHVKKMPINVALELD